MNAAALRATGRIARRDAWRHKGRSALIVAMVAIPVLGLTAADVLARTVQLSNAEVSARDIGTADVGLSIYGGTIRYARADGSDYVPSRRNPLTPGTARYDALKARALRLLHPTATATLTGSYVAYRANGYRVPAALELADLRNPLTTGLVQWRGGTAPTTDAQLALSVPLADQLHAGIGDTVSSAGHKWRVTGLVREPRQLDVQTAYALPGSVSVAPSHASRFILARTAAPVSWSTVQRLGAIGVVAISANVLAHPPTSIDRGNPISEVRNRTKVGIATVAIGMATLEAVLLAAAAFAVGARRQRHDLALVAAVGGDARRVAQVVLASGAVLGLAGALLGAPLGVLAAKLSLGSIATLSNRAPGHFDVRGLEIAAAIAIGVIASLLAAVLPARTAARDDVVAALTGRRDAPTQRHRMPLLGLALVVIGTAIAIDHARSHQFRWILVGAILCELGFVVVAPAVVGGCGRLARYLPLAPRLALRDSSRHRSRTGPAVAAVMAAVAGAMAASSYIVSQSDHGRSTYVPLGRVDEARLTFFGKSVTPAQRNATITKVRQVLGAGSAVPLTTAYCQVAPTGKCQDFYLGAIDRNSAIAVGDSSTLKTVTGTVDPKAAQTLAAGGLVEFDSGATGPRPSIVGSGSVTGRIAHVARYRQHVGARGAAVSGMISPATAAKLDLRTEVATYLLPTSATPSVGQADLAAEQVPVGTALLDVERGYDAGKYPVGELLLAIAAAVVALGATAISLGLSMAEGRGDLATLSAVGSGPATRRLLVASQAGSIALVGGVLGVIAGVLPSWAVLHANGEVPFVFPWEMVLITAVAVPAAAMLISAACAGTHTIVDRRLT